MSNTDVSTVLIGGFSGVVLILFLVQAFREAFPAIDNRFLPLVSIALGLGLISLGTYAPTVLAKTLATGIALGAAASLSVRYVKNGDSPTAEPQPVSVVQSVAVPEVAAEEAKPVAAPPLAYDIPNYAPLAASGPEDANAFPSVTMPPTR
jgi:hypothetical protein